MPYDNARRLNFMISDKNWGQSYKVTENDLMLCSVTNEMLNNCYQVLLRVLVIVRYCYLYFQL